jgi:hypothetical protein
MEIFQRLMAEDVSLGYAIVIWAKCLVGVCTVVEPTLTVGGIRRYET